VIWGLFFHPNKIHRDCRPLGAATIFGGESNGWKKYINK
jgi:hypothetical protein